VTSREAIGRLSVTAGVVILLVWVISRSKTYWYWTDVWSSANRDYIVGGLLLTIVVSAGAMVVGLLLGALAGLGRMSHRVVPNQLATLYVEFIRGTPLIVQIYIAWFCLADVVHLEDRTIMGILALGFFSGAYNAEILRAGVEAVPRGQLEAARSLGMSHARAMLHVIGPQAIKNALPPLTGQFLNLIKDSSLLMMIGVTELMKRSEELQGLTHAPFEVYLPLAGLYLLITFPLSRFTGWLEKKMGGTPREHRL
jgi:polar amino acid transport system permease protein